MTKLIVFDLDGVLVSSKELHYQSLNEALAVIDKKYVINIDEHLAKYDGLPTSKKLQMLSKDKGLPIELHKRVWELKQEKTIEIIKRDTVVDVQKCKMLQKLKSDGYKLAVASNSIRDTVKFILLRTGMMEYIDRYYSNEDVRVPKPHSEIYQKIMIDFGMNCKETLIIEDSHIGRTAAENSGARLLGVRDPQEVTYENINNFINSLSNKKSHKWMGGKMNVLIPMAGAGSRFEKAGYTFPKPLIEVQKLSNKPMIQVIVENLNIDAHYIFIVQKSHYEKYNLKQMLNLIAPGCDIVQVDGITEGAACTTLLAKSFINNNEPLVIANSDQFIDWNSNEFMYAITSDNIDGGILTFTATHPKWSYAKLDSNGFVAEVAEKNPISNIATVGVYYWRKGSDYVKYAEQMIQNNTRVNNEFYVCPVFNEAIRDGKKIKVYGIKQMFGLGTPEDLEYFNKYWNE